LWAELGGAVESSLALDATDLVVDALFGNGLARPLGDPWKSAIERVNASRVPVLAVDLPSGLDADTGEVLGAAVRATETVTFIAPKLGFFRGAGPDHVGRLHVEEIGVPRAWIEDAIARRARG
jgi:NAD(P)H-hydrate epimerase